ncbi:hypothetical protein VCV18_006395 [Metarhizium anisopliae]
MLASRSAIASESSAKAGSKAFSGNSAPPPRTLRAESRKEDREDGRSGVVGLELRAREFERFRLMAVQPFASSMPSDMPMPN